MKYLSIILIILTLFSIPLAVGVDNAANTVWGPKCAAPDPAEKKTLAAAIAVYFRLKGAVKFLNRCYSTYQGIVSTEEQIENLIDNYNNYWTSIYDQFESGTTLIGDGLANIRDAALSGNVTDAINGFDVVVSGLSGYENVFFKVDDFFRYDVNYMQYLINGKFQSLAALGKSPFNGAFGRFGRNDHENALKVIKSFYDNTENIRGILEGGDETARINKKRTLFEWDCFITAQSMKLCGDVTKQMNDVIESAKQFQDLGDGLESEGEQLGYQRFLTLGHLDLDFIECRLAVQEVALQKELLLRENVNMYHEIGDRTYEALSFEKLAKIRSDINPYEFEPSLTVSGTLESEMELIKENAKIPLGEVVN